MPEENRIINVRGIGHAVQAPDKVVLSLTLTAQNKEYAAALKVGSQQIEMLRESVVAVGFNAEDIKTVNFDVRTIYEDEEYRSGNTKRYRSAFVGFECRHNLQLAFDFDNEKLNAATNAIANCLSQPKISIAFTVKDIAAFNDKILESAAHDARRKAEILCVASGVKLGKLIRISYPCDEEINRREVVFANQEVLGCSTDTAFDFQPEDVKADAAVDFIWEIV
ncbi:MAG: SIMPL domain-containing protein [Selenomonadaceae bacterium]|nr:SIMPL domain-containing protein [Selenomonadaceae bacterium]